ncbi:MAG: glycosyltransferase family 4 protein [Thermoplasmatota archaeon]
MNNNILQLCVRYPPAPGGAETHVKELSERLSNIGYDIEIYTSDLYQEFPFKRLEEKPKDKIKNIKVKRHKAYTLKGDLHYLFYPKMFRSLCKNNFDLYHAHSYGYFHVNLAAFFKHIKDNPFVLTPHFHPEWSMWGGEKRRKIRSIYDTFIAQKVIDSTDRIIGVSRNEINLLKERLSIPEEKIKIIPNGIDPDKFTPIPEGDLFREKYDIEGKIILYAGRLASNKGLIQLVESIPKVKEDNPKVNFVIVGEDEGMEEKIIKRANELGVEENLRVIGYIEDYNIFKSSYSAADVFVLPSEYEAFGIVLLEAMMCETPCIGTKVGGIPEVINNGKTGLLIQYDDIKALSDTINQLLDNAKLRRKMGKMGRKRVLQKFTWKKVAISVSEVYDEIL